MCDQPPYHGVQQPQSAEPVPPQQPPAAPKQQPPPPLPIQKHVQHPHHHQPRVVVARLPQATRQHPFLVGDCDIDDDDDDDDDDDALSLMNSCHVLSSRHEKLRKKQVCLLLLLHAETCQHEGPPRCPVTRYCGYWRKVWDHITVCKERKCWVSQCASSNRVLKHYRRCGCCKFLSCQVCDPIREAIRQDRVEQMQNEMEGFK